MKFRRKIPALLMLMLGIFSTSLAWAAANAYTTASTYMYSSPTTQSTVVMSIPAHASVYVDRCKTSQNWCHATFKVNNRGWIESSFLQFSTSTYNHNHWVGCPYDDWSECPYYSHPPYQPSITPAIPLTPAESISPATIPAIQLTPAKPYSPPATLPTTPLTPARPMIPAQPAMSITPAIHSVPAMPLQPAQTENNP